MGSIEMSAGRGWFFCLGALLLGGSLCAAPMIDAVRQSDLKTPWGNAALDRSRDGSVELVSKNAEGAAAAVAANLPVPSGSECRLSFEARGDVRLQVMLRFSGGAKDKRVDIVMPEQLDRKEWKTFERSFTVPPGYDKVLLDFLIWKQAGRAEIRNYRLRIPLRRGEIVLFDQSFRQGAYRNSRFDSRLPAFWLEFRSVDAPAGEIGGLYTGNPPVPGGKSLRIPAAPSGYWGWCSLDTPLPRPFRPMELRVQYRISPDFSGNEIQLRLVFRGKGKDLMGKQIVYRLPLGEKGTWIAKTFRVEPDRIPAEADAFRVALQTGRSGTEKTAGSVCFGPVRIALPESDGAFARISSVRDLNWYSLGETVRFKAEGALPDGTTAVIGKVRRSNGSPVAEIPVPAEAMRTSGWTFRPTEPGYYEVVFVAETPRGPVSLAGEYADRARNGGIELFSRDSRSFAVIDGKGPEKTSDFFGYQAFFHPWKIQQVGDLEFRIARTVGGKYLRFGASWDLIEPERGVFRWGLLDYYIDHCRKLGLRPLIGLSSTPRWASSHPEDNRWVICKWGYEGWAPKDFSDWENFIAKLVSRYKDRVFDWEIWNEPNLPGVSCFWHDTPENFVRVMKTAHRTIKRIQPDSNVLGSGYSDHYLPFYDRIIRLGAGDTFDTLSIHGLDCTVAAFHAIDRKYGAPKHRVFNSEWHWGLLRYDYPTMSDSEEKLSLKMMKALFDMIGRGVGGASVFEPLNMAEKETLSHHAAGGDPLTHTSGIFRRLPSVQPRLAAVIFANLARRFLTGIPVVKAMYRVGAVKMVLLDTADGPYLAFWQEGKTPLAIPPEAAKAISRSRVRDWEDRPVGAPAAMTLRPDVVYFARTPDIPAGWKSDASILREEEADRPLLHEVSGVYSRKPILTKSGEPIPENIHWNDQFQLIRLGTAPKGFAKPTRFAAAFADGRFQLIVETADSVHHQEESGRDLWKGDSLEFVLDIRGRGVFADTFGFSAARIPGGRNLLRKGHAPTVVGDCPTVWTSAWMPVETGRCDVLVQPEKKRTVYRVDIPVTEFYPHLPKDGQNIRFSLLVNDNDGKTRFAAVRWANGIVGGKDPARYGDLKAVSSH